MTPDRNPLACEADGGLRRLKKWKSLNFQNLWVFFRLYTPQTKDLSVRDETLVFNPTQMRHLQKIKFGLLNNNLLRY